MECQSCGASNPDGSDFCHRCGGELTGGRTPTSDTGMLFEDFASETSRAKKIDVVRSTRLMVAGGVIFVLLFLAAMVFSFIDSAVGTVLWMCLMALLLLLTLSATRSLRALKFVAPLMILLAIIAASTDMGGNAFFNRLSTPIVCDDDATLRVEKRIQNPYAGKLVTEYVFFCQLEGNEWRAGSAAVTGAHALIYTTYALLLLLVYVVIAWLARSRSQAPPMMTY